MILPRSWKVCLVRRFVLDVHVSVISRREDLGMCFELYGILASDEISEERFSVTTTFFEPLDAEVDWIIVADICEHRVCSTRARGTSLLLWQQVSLPTAEVYWIRTEAVAPPYVAGSTLMDLSSWFQEHSLRPSLEVVVLVRAAGGEFLGGRDRVFGRQGMSAITQSCRTVVRSRSADLDSWLDSLSCGLLVVWGESWGICCLEAHSAICLEFLLGGVKTLC